MKRRAQRSQSSRKSAGRDSLASESRALVRVDGTGIRQKIKKDYEKALRDVEKSRRQLEEFHQTDLPQFVRWLNTKFGELLTELRELNQKMAADQELIMEVENEIIFGGCSEARAYQRVMEFRENPEGARGGSPGGSEADGEGGPFGGGAESGNAEDEDDPIAEIMNEFFGQAAPGARTPHNAGPVFEETPDARRASQRIKELYRAVVRRLHPDVQREMTAQKTEWWHQAQAAYEAGDVEQMEVILTLCEIDDSGTTEHTSASLLQRITARLKNSLREIKRQLAERRKDIAWNFSRRTDHEEFAGQMRGLLMNDLGRMRYQYRATQEMIARWKVAAEHLKQPRRRKSYPSNMEFSL